METEDSQLHVPLQSMKQTPHYCLFGLVMVFRKTMWIFTFL